MLAVRFEYMMKNRQQQWFLFLPQKAIVLYLYLHYVLHMLDITEEETSSFFFHLKRRMFSLASFSLLCDFLAVVTHRKTRVVGGGEVGWGLKRIWWR